MKKPPKPQRAKRGSKSIGNYFVKDGDGKQINLGTKNAQFAIERAREFARTGKRNFQDDLDGAAESTIAAVEGAAPPVATAPPIEQPAAGPPPLPPPAALPPTQVTPQQAAPVSSPAPSGNNATDAAPGIEPAPPAGGAPPPAADWREDAKAAAEQSAAAGDAKPAAEAKPMIDPNMIEQFVQTGGKFLCGAQIWMQGKIVEWGVGEKPEPLFPTLEWMAKSGQLPADMYENVTMVRDLSAAGYAAFIRRKLDIERLPDWAVGLIAAGSLGTVQWSMAAAAKAQKAAGKKRGTSEPLGMPKPTPAAPPPAGDNGVGAEPL